MGTAAGSCSTSSHLLRCHFPYCCSLQTTLVDTSILNRLYFRPFIMSQTYSQPQSSVPSEYGPTKQEAPAYPQGLHQLPSKFQFGLFDCFSPFSTCFLTCCCPCVTFGRIKARESGEKDPSGINGMCALHCLLLYCGVAPVLQFVNRMSMREKYGMESNGCGDCLTAFCCACCELIQEDKETIIRTTGMDPKTEQPYVPPQGMTYP